MPNLNKMLVDVQNRSGRIKEDIMNLLRDYEGLLHEANGIYMSQRIASGSEGLEDFYRLIQVIKRNRDVIGSLARGVTNVRPTDKFRFIEEDLAKETMPLPPQIKRKQRAQEPQPTQAPALEDIEAQMQPEVNNG